MTASQYAALLERVGQFAGAKLDPEKGSLLIFTDHRMVNVVMEAISLAGLRMRGVITWDKKAPGRGKGFLPQSEFIVHFTTGASLNAYDHAPNVLSHKRLHHTKRRHPTEKPIALLQDLLRVVTPEGGLVCDPFCGSGSLGEAAHLLGRRAVLSDWDHVHAQTAANRLLSLTQDKAHG